MAQAVSEPILTAVFVDYDNIYLSLKRRNEDAAKRFAKDAGLWIKEIENGRLLSFANGQNSGLGTDRPRRIVLNRCYGNPVPRRNSHDNSTDMNSFPFVRHHFLRAGFEVVDCPPLTAQLKNSSDIRMVMDVRDFLGHETRFEEFIIMSGDADFTPVLHRLRAHARRTIIFANDYTAAPYTAIADGEVKESHLLAVLLDGRLPQPAEKPAVVTELASHDRLRAEIVTAVAMAVRAAPGPIPLEALAERTTRALGHDRTVGTGWAGAGSFLELLRSALPADIGLTDQPPYLAFEAKRGIAQATPPQAIERRERIEPVLLAPAPIGRSQIAQSPVAESQRQQAPLQRQPVAQRDIFGMADDLEHARPPLPRQIASQPPQQQIAQQASQPPRPAARPQAQQPTAATAPVQQRAGARRHGDPTVDRAHPRRLSGAAAVAAGVSRAVRDHGERDQRGRAARRADVGQYRGAGSGHRAVGAARRRALHHGRHQRG